MATPLPYVKNAESLEWFDGLSDIDVSRWPMIFITSLNPLLFEGGQANIAFDLFHFLDSHICSNGHLQTLSWFSLVLMEQRSCQYSWESISSPQSTENWREAQQSVHIPEINPF